MATTTRVSAARRQAELGTRHVLVDAGTAEGADAKHSQLFRINIARHSHIRHLRAVHLASGRVVGVIQLMLERDMAGSLTALGRSIDPTPENLALDVPSVP